MQRLGIFGGTFNPVHNIHLNMALHFVLQMKLDVCLFVPAYISPFKTEITEEIIPAEHRLKMLELALQSYQKLTIETYEINKKGISYTIDTINYLNEKYPEAELNLLIGSDQLKDFTQWKNWEIILKIVNLCVVKRPETDLDNFTFLSGKGKIQFIDIAENALSSSKIREMVKNNESISGLVPYEVEKYIKENNLYK